MLRAINYLLVALDYGPVLKTVVVLDYIEVLMKCVFTTTWVVPHVPSCFDDVIE